MILKQINNNMKHSTLNKKHITVITSKPTLRTITIHVSPRKWYGCIYYSSHDLTGQVLLLLREMKGEYNGKFLNYPIIILKATKKCGVEIKIKEKLQSLINQN